MLDRHAVSREGHLVLLQSCCCGDRQTHNLPIDTGSVVVSRQTDTVVAAPANVEGGPPSEKRQKTCFFAVKGKSCSAF